MRIQIFPLLVLVGSALARSGLVKDPFFLNQPHRTGSIPLGEGDDIFYWYFESRHNPETAPLVMWLTGGPGCSSMLAVLTQHGPFSVDSNLKLHLRDPSWTELANVVYVDQPIGTGFSRNGTELHITKHSYTRHMRTFIDGFLEHNPELRDRDFYITGESYAGHFVPAIAAYFMKTVV
jgi:cathepsin A (carboxypeptidase C)